MKMTTNKKMSTILLIFLLPCLVKPTLDEAVFTISHFSDMPNAFVFGSSEPLRVPIMPSNIPTLRYDSEIIEGYAHPYYVETFNLDYSIQSVKVTFSASCPFPLVLFSKYTMFDVNSLSANKIVFKADGIGIREVEKKISDFYSGGVFSAAPQDYKKIGERFHRQTISLSPQTDTKGAFMILYCPFLREGYDVFDYTLQLVERQKDIRVLAGLSNQGDGFFVYLQTLFVPFLGSVRVQFPIEQFNGTIALNTSYPASLDVNFTYYVYDERRGKTLHDDDLFINPLELRSAENATLTFSNSGADSLYIHVRMTGKSLFRDYGTNSPRPIGRSALKNIMILLILAIFSTLVIILLAIARSALITSDDPKQEASPSADTSMDIADIIINSEKMNLSGSYQDLAERHQGANLAAIPVFGSRANSTDPQMMSETSIVNTEGNELMTIETEVGYSPKNRARNS